MSETPAIVAVGGVCYGKRIAIVCLVVVVVVVNVDLELQSSLIELEWDTRNFLVETPVRPSTETKPSDHH